ncbi:amidohydrolase family protein [Paraglaciecola aestuariivivens]
MTLVNNIIGLCLFVSSVAVAASDTLYIQAKTLYTSSDKGVMNNATIVVKDGKIHQVASKIKLPTNADVIEADVVTPGFIDSHTMVGVNGAFNISSDQDAFEKVDNMGAEYRILDSFNPNETLIKHARKFGVTTIHVTPQPAAPVGGVSAIFKTAGNTADEMALRTEAAMMFNLGEAPKNYFKSSGGPTTRMATAALIRESLYKAKAWSKKDKNKRKPDLAMQALAKVLSGEIEAIFTAHSEHDISTALRIAKEFKLKPIINYGTEGYLMRHILRAAGATIITAPTMQRSSPGEKQNASLEAARFYHAANIPFVFSSGYEGYVPKTRVLLWEMAIAVANGLDKQSAIKAATSTPAKLWGLSKNIGSIEKGKDADLVLYQGDPFEYTSKVTGVYIKGQRVSEGG